MVLVMCPDVVLSAWIDSLHFLLPRVRVCEQGIGAACTCRLFEGKSHTSFLIEGPMCGGRDLLMDVILEVVKGAEQNHIYGALCPRILCNLAGWICPF